MQKPCLWDGDHHHSAAVFGVRTKEWALLKPGNDEFLQRDSSSNRVCASKATDRTAATSTINSMRIDSSLGVDWTVKQTQRCRGLFTTTLDLHLKITVKSGRSDIESLFEEGTFHRIWLVEEG